MNATRLQQELLKPRKWFDLAESNDTAEFYIYDVIGADFWGDGLRAIDFINQVKSAKSNNIHIHINSPGGDAYDGVAIYNALIDTKKNVRTIIDGIAASSASIIFSAGKERIMPTGAMEMIHRAWTFAMGNCKDMTKAATALERLDGNLASIYHATSNHGEKKIIDLMDAETYMDGKEAVKLGFATEEVEGLKIAALKWDRNILPGIPDSFNRMQTSLNKRDAEAVLRDVGWSIAEAKKLAAGPRDEENDSAEICRLIAKNIEILK
jgi:ATP-dependent protease ClpP protease subunit